MAEGAVVKILIEKVYSLITTEISMIKGADEEMKKLESTLSAIQSVLEDAELTPRKSVALQNWLMKIKEAAYEVEDTLDEYATEGSILESKGGNFKLVDKNLFRDKIARGIKKMNKKLDALAEERRKFHLSETTGVPNSSEVDLRRHRETMSTLIEPDHVYGREEDKKKIVGMLVNDQVEQVFVLPILGVGGLGKTTLAQLVYNDERVSQHFDAKLWVCVSDIYDLKKILKDMIESATGSASDLVQLDALQRRVHDLLCDKRCLLVLDDVWNENDEDWAKLKGILIHATKSKGLSIVVTTRLGKVANIMGNVSTHSLEELSEEHIWLLFKLRAFKNPEEAEKYLNLEAIGRRIIKKCGGVPLAAKALGSSLQFSKEERDWLRVENSEIWNLSEKETQILPALRLSYHNLPLEIRQCFVYCAVFPKDSKMVKRDLIFRWMAHGFISSNGNDEVEDVGDQVWNELVIRSIFQEIGTTLEGQTTCKMHDLIHDLAQSILGNKVYGVKMTANLSKKSCSKVRELFHFRNSPSSATMLTSIMDYTRLRTLKIQDGEMEELPTEINKLKYLRYLDLTSSKIRDLPRTFCSLWNLQILILNKCSSLRSLPEDIRCMTNQRHIFLEGCHGLTDMPSGIGEMTLLKTLSLFIVGHGVGNQLDQLQHLNLGGSLKIRNLGRTTNPTYASNANLAKKSNLYDLDLSWEETGDYLMQDHEDVLEALEPHPNLKTLSISGFKGRNIPFWMTKMNNVTKIHIRDSKHCLNISPLGHLPHLKYLYLWVLSGLEYIAVQDYETQCQNSVGAKLFPSLEELWLENLRKLKGLLKDGEIVFPNLRELTIRDCEKLTLHPFELSNLERLILWINKPRAVVSSLSKAKLEKLTYLELKFSVEWEVKGAWDALCKLIQLRVCNAKEQHLPEKWFQGVKSLKSLELRDCEIGRNIIGGGLRHLTALEMLEIYGRSWLEELPGEIEHLHLLKRLRLKSLNFLASLPQCLQHLPLLESILLSRLPKLTSLPECLPKLTSLDIDDCPMLTSLPSLAMPNLTSLVIKQCPQLEKRCEKKKGEDWHKIAHVPHLDIGSRVGSCSDLASSSKTIVEIIHTIEQLLEDEKSGEFWIHGRFKCTAMSYLACKTCFNELVPYEKDFFCETCQSVEIIENISYKLTIEVEDDTGKALFYIWDNEVLKLIGNKPSDLCPDGLVGFLVEEIENNANKKFYFKVLVLPEQTKDYKGPFMVNKTECGENMMMGGLNSENKEIESKLRKGKGHMYG